MIAFDKDTCTDFETALTKEWIETNGLGGFASSTIISTNTRRYHGLLVAAMAPPVHRMVLLSRVEETVRCDGWPTPLACNEYPDTIHPQGHESLFFPCKPSLNGDNKQNS